MGVPREAGVRISKAEKQQTAWASGSQAETLATLVWMLASHSSGPGRTLSSPPTAGRLA